ncbi:esterase-like activity of phytase family protein [Paracoccus laeviglucosivorans]|uniref:esterase-like activity of phytase family protein n=1 Tax=Paracoccus laeviglucosivorans TaxID=1197861 RepID=UPI001FE80D67|nr:esterase-like activity of phytase family protein [Paracoccus laeviglucosivorans]
MTLSQSCAAQPEAAARNEPPQVEYVGTHIWHMPHEDFGGFSAIEIEDDGTRFTALSDRATMRWGRIERGDDGRIAKMVPEGHTRLKDSRGRALKPGWVGDSEGIAIGKDGKIWVSFEGLTRVARYDTHTSNATPLPRPQEFKKMQRNSSLEALAITDDGTLLTLPERSGALGTPFPVWRFRDGKWDQPFSIPRSGDWLAVGADMGPDGRFYLLERDFLGLLGFRTRVRRFDLGPDGFSNEQILLSSYPLQYDNLEGISVWEDEQGIRLTMISDDNFSRLQRTELVEYRVTEDKP